MATEPMDDTRRGKQTSHRSQDELVKAHPNLLPYSNDVLCPRCGAVVNVNRVKTWSDVPVGWCPRCGIGIE